MNDFTKEELITIFDGLHHLPTINETYDSDLCLKVESMIDNYCEHEWDYNQHDMPINCRKCNKGYP
jgi:hypothetical protein